MVYTVSGLTYWYRQRKRRKGPLVRVLCFHDVADRAWFEQIIMLCVQRYHVLSPDQFHARDFHQDKINLLLTFDDGYQSWVDTVLPVLHAQQIRGLFFINSGLLEAAVTGVSDQYMSDRLYLTPKLPLTWSTAKTLLAAGHTIGGHTVQHQSLGQITEAEIRREVHDDKQTIEDTLAIKISDFAYPYGTAADMSITAQAIIQAAPYRYQYSGCTDFVLPDRHFSSVIPRTLLERNQPVWSVRQWIEGGYDMFKGRN